MTEALIVAWAVGTVVTFLPWVRGTYNREPHPDRWKESTTIPRKHKGWALAVGLLYAPLWPLFALLIGGFWLVEGLRWLGNGPLRRLTDWVVGA